MASGNCTQYGRAPMVALSDEGIAPVARCGQLTHDVEAPGDKSRAQGRGRACLIPPEKFGLHWRKICALPWVAWLTPRSPLMTLVSRRGVGRAFG
jgi:hypothetical protein